ncbi:hypothetical protein ACIRST_09865 [Kitasatospora sp. NPDC101447]|uniref:hypothetical protein n=1 Tax=unclassified Kitasatospora TaxID=2633591 RepID=UPI0037C51EE4
MKLRTRIRAGITALAVAAGGLTVAVAGPAATAHACGLSQLGPTRYIWSGGHTMGTFYLAWDSCTSGAYTEAHITNTNWTRANGFIEVRNSSGGGSEYGPASPTVVWDGTAWWDSFLPGHSKLSIYSNPSSDRLYYGIAEFSGCSREGHTPEWNFSNGSVVNSGQDMLC